MSKNFYSAIHLHITWHTKESAPLLSPDLETFVHRCLKKRIVDAPGVYLHEIGGTATHLHLALTVPPTLGVAEFIGQLKGASAHDANQQFRSRGKVLVWQSGYGVVSFGTANMDWVCAYIRNQPAHHQQGTVQERLERIADSESSGQGPSSQAP